MRASLQEATAHLASRRGRKFRGKEVAGSVPVSGRCSVDGAARGSRSCYGLGRWCSELMGADLELQPFPGYERDQRDLIVAGPDGGRRGRLAQVVIDQQVKLLVGQVIEQQR